MIHFILFKKLCTDFIYDYIKFILKLSLNKVILFLDREKKLIVDSWVFTSLRYHTTNPSFSVCNADSILLTVTQTDYCAWQVYSFAVYGSKKLWMIWNTNTILVLFLASWEKPGNLALCLYSRRWWSWGKKGQTQLWVFIVSSRFFEHDIC